MTHRKETAPTPGDLEVEVEKSPNEELAKKVITCLIDEDLMSAADGERIRLALTTGKLSGADWKLAFENHLERHGAGDEPK
jgi:hypothetical protein